MTGQFTFGSEAWVGSVIWWVVQGKVTITLFSMALPKLLQ